MPPSLPINLPKRKRHAMKNGMNTGALIAWIVPFISVAFNAYRLNSIWLFIIPVCIGVAATRLFQSYWASRWTKIREVNDANAEVKAIQEIISPESEKLHALYSEIKIYRQSCSMPRTEAQKREEGRLQEAISTQKEIIDELRRTKLQPALDNSKAAVARMNAHLKRKSSLS